MIRIELVSPAVDPLDMRADTDTAMARVVTICNQTNPRYAYLVTNRRANRVKVLVHDGLGIRLCALRLRKGKFTWAGGSESHRSIMAAQLQALVTGLPWQRVGNEAVICTA